MQRAGNLQWVLAVERSSMGVRAIMQVRVAATARMTVTKSCGVVMVVMQLAQRVCMVCASPRSFATHTHTLNHTAHLNPPTDYPLHSAYHH